MDFGDKVKILSDLMFWRNDLDDRLIEFFLPESNDLAVRWAVGVEMGYIHQLSDDAEAIVENAFDSLLWHFDLPEDGRYSDIWQILPPSFEVPEQYDWMKYNEEHGRKVR